MKNKLLFLFVACLLTLSGKAQPLPLYTITGRDTTVQIFLYSPGISEGLHAAYLDGNQNWQELGQVLTCDYGPWGSGKKMYTPFVTKANDGSWRALWSLDHQSPAFAAAYSEDLIHWRPQDYPVVREHDVMAPVAYQMDDGSWDIYFKTPQGKRYVHASDDFRTFAEDTLQAVADDVLWQQDTAVVGGKVRYGNTFEVPAVHLRYMQNWFRALAQDQALCSERMKDDRQRFSALGDTLRSTLVVDPLKVHRISNRLMGVFFEDINSAADGGLYAEMVRNRDFEDPGNQKNAWAAHPAWKLYRMVSKKELEEEPLSLVTDHPLSKHNPHYVVLGKDEVISNSGWDGMPVKAGFYDFSFFANQIEGDKNQIEVSLISDDGTIVAKDKVKLEGTGWRRYALSLNTVPKKKEAVEAGYKNCHLQLLVKKEGKVGVDMISLFPHDTYKGHGMRKDLAETIAALHPKFMRFPGGCLVHGQGLSNIYRWKETIGPWQDRVPAPNIWNYHQTRGLGFYEFFQFCEDIGAEPLPVVAAGVSCQNSRADADGLAGQQGGIPMKDMPQYVQDVLDLIEWANGDPATSKWAKMRADEGHPAPFHLKMIGIGNEDLISTVFEKRYLMICQAVKKAYPAIEVIGTAGPFHDPSSDYTEGWRFARAHADCIDAVDEHYYERPGWFLHHQDYYDDYSRKSPVVYLGEYASQGRTVENALAEAVYLCSIERNADVVQMASYAPLLCRKGYMDWNPDLIYFDGTSVEVTPSYWVQYLFSNYSGDQYVSSHLDVAAPVAYRIASSVVRSSKTGRGYIKLVNASPKTVIMDVKGVSLVAGKEEMQLQGDPSDRLIHVRRAGGLQDQASPAQIQGQTVILPPYSVNVVDWK
ncbi:MAG: alpha-N-arabinofuranosidase [Prevotella sp.]|jgi:alpha-L-arabinofuranosidase|nr:alpha-N-arabinofuranosidase [Prevotella sp.]MCH4216467.1 alpha-N-arabinofuranosidase [Prevotella sp.]MCI2151324.1 alpha-N-arabinofuranosidase [Prevotella sp.]